MKRRSVNARGKGNGSLANECLQWPIWIRLSWIFRLLLHLEGTYTSGIPGHIFMDFSTLHAYYCSPHTYFQTGHRTRLSGIIPHFHVFSSYECSSQLCTRFSSVLYNTHRFSLPLCVGLVVILLMDRTIWSSILFTVDISFSCLILTHNNSFLRTFFPDDLPPHPTALQSFTVHAQSYLISLV